MIETSKFQSFKRALLSYNPIQAEKVVFELNKQMNIFQIVEKLICPVLEEIGSEWEQGTVALSQVYMSGRVCERIMDCLLPPESPIRRNKPAMAIVTLEDHHALGKRIILSTLRASGYELKDFGQGIMVDDLVDRVTKEGIKILLISTLMLSSALKVKDLREKLNSLGCEVKIIVGGAPFSLDTKLWAEVGADALGKSASDILRTIQEMAVDLN